MGSELKRPVGAFAVVSLLCAVLMIVSTGRVDAVLGVFDAPRPISAPAATRVPTPAALPDAPAVVSVPDELMAAPVGSSTREPQAAAKTAKTAKKADTADRKAVRKADRA